MAQIVISDAWPLIALAGIDHPGILQRLFGEVTLCQSVRDECLAKQGADTQRLQEALKTGWLIVHSDKPLLTPLTPSLGKGESDSIHLALKSPHDSLLIMDDRLARRYALRKDLNIIGTVRLLDLAEQRGLINSTIAAPVFPRSSS